MRQETYTRAEREHRRRGDGYRARWLRAWQRWISAAHAAQGPLSGPERATAAVAIGLVRLGPAPVTWLLQLY